MYKQLIFLGISLLLSSSASEEDLYSVLGVGRAASQAEIKRAYKTLAKEWYDYVMIFVDLEM